MQGIKKELMKQSKKETVKKDNWKYVCMESLQQRQQQQQATTIAGTCIVKDRANTIQEAFKLCRGYV